MREQQLVLKLRKKINIEIRNMDPSYSILIKIFKLKNISNASDDRRYIAKAAQ